MKILPILATLPLTATALASAESMPWFETSTPLTQAHKHLLEDNLPMMFSSLVEVWQQDQTNSLSDHLNQLLLQSLETDCGKTLNDTSLPEWISAITVRRIELQSPGRDSYRAVVDVETNKTLQNVSLTRWVSKEISTDDTLVSEPSRTNSSQAKYLKRYNLNSELEKGLYRVEVTADDKMTWGSWIILGTEKPKFTIRWNGKEDWVIEKSALLNPYCPLPKLDTAIYDYIDESYTQVWSESYDSEYPTSIEQTYPVGPGRYVLAVSMQHQRWQGPVIIEQSQIISRTYDVSVEE